MTQAIAIDQVTFMCSILEELEGKEKGGRVNEIFPGYAMEAYKC